MTFCGQVALTFAFLAVLSVARVTSSPPGTKLPCPDASLITPCSCQGDGLDVVVDCSAAPSTEFLLTLFSSGPFLTDNMDTFRIVGNSNIKAIPQNFFKRYSFKNVVISSNPSLTSVDENAFQGGEATLEHLDLSANALTSLTLLDNLAGFVNLNYIDMGSNQISGAVRAFTCPPALLQLWLHKNQLTAIDPNAFATCTNVKYLGVGGNAFTSFGANAFAGLDNVEILAVNVCGNLQVIQTGAFPFTSEKLTELRLMGNAQLKLVEKNAIAGQPCSSNVLLNNCALTTLEEESFRPMLEEFSLAGCGGYLDVSGCPIQCNCDMAWLLVDPGLKIHVKGTCQDGIEFVNQPEDPWMPPGCNSLLSGKLPFHLN